MNREREREERKSDRIIKETNHDVIEITSIVFFWKCINPPLRHIEIEFFPDYLCHLAKGSS